MLATATTGKEQFEVQCWGAGGYPKNVNGLTWGKGCGRQEDGILGKGLEARGTFKSKVGWKGRLGGARSNKARSGKFLRKEVTPASDILKG